MNSNNSALSTTPLDGDGERVRALQAEIRQLENELIALSELHDQAVGRLRKFELFLAQALGAARANRYVPRSFVNLLQRFEKEARL